MHSFILISPDKEQLKTYVQQFGKEHAISTFDQLTFEGEKASVGIEDIRNIQKNIYLAPYQGESKLIAIQNAHTLTIEAQNALLKLLEEPPTHTYIFLLASENTFLPTILSRCKLIVLPAGEKEPLDDKEYIASYETVCNGLIGDKLALAEKLAGEKENLPTWFEGMILLLRRKMLDEPEKSRKVIRLLERLQEGYKLFKTTNVNTRLLLEHLFLNTNF